MYVRCRDEDMDALLGGGLYGGGRPVNSLLVRVGKRRDHRAIRSTHLPRDLMHCCPITGRGYRKAGLY